MATPTLTTYMVEVEEVIQVTVKRLVAVEATSADEAEEWVASIELPERVKRTTEVLHESDEVTAEFISVKVVGPEALAGPAFDCDACGAHVATPDAEQHENQLCYDCIYGQGEPNSDDEDE
jgi:formylmethanofuran dehydrogenase subunit E